MLVGRLLMTIAIFWWRTTKIITTTSMFAGDTRKNSNNNNSTKYSLGFLSGMSVLHWRVIWPVYTARRRMILCSIWPSQIVRVPTMDLPGWEPVASDLVVSGMMGRCGTLRIGSQVIFSWFGHTWYLSFFLHGQNFWRIKLTRKKRVNYDKIHSKLPIFCIITAKYTVNCQFFALNL